MFDYLQQFNKLPKDLRDQVSSPTVMAALSDIENRYKIDLAMTVIKIMVKKLPLSDLGPYFVNEFSLNKEQADSLSQEMKQQVFSGVVDYLTSVSRKEVTKSGEDISDIIKEVSLMLPSEDLVLRFKNIIATYIKGVRNKIDTRSTLAKDIASGGLNLSNEEIDRIFKICDQKTFKDLSVKLTPTLPASRLNKIIQQADIGVAKDEYNLKKALANKEISSLKKTVPSPPKAKMVLDTTHELPLPKDKLDQKLIALKIKTTDKKLLIEKPKDDKTRIKVVTGKKVINNELPLTGLVKDKAVYKIEKPPARTHFITKLFSEKNKKELSPIKESLPSKSIIKEKANQVKKADQVKKDVPSIPIVKKEISVKKTIPDQKESTVLPRPSMPISKDKPQVHDIKSIPKVMGPIEELQFLDLINFHRLAKTPEEIVAKVFSKIKLLESEGYDKMIAGVKAWRQSPVSRLYLRIGQEAIAHGQSMKEAVQQREKEKKEYLTMAEIEAIVSLNSKLIF